MTRYLTTVDAAYDIERRGYNLVVEHKPETIVAVQTVEDVVAAVRYATRRGLCVAVQATGHGPSRPVDGQVLITTSRMDGVSVDPVERTARVEAGVRGAALVAAAAEHDLAPLTGSAPEVGVVGYHLGGGLGILGRSLGWAVDHVHAIEVVTADGVLRRATAETETDLFWALRGGGRGTLGVVVALEIGLHPITRLYGGGMHFPAETAAAALATWAEWTRTAPEAMGSSVLLMQMPDLPTLPEAMRGRYLATSGLRSPGRLPRVHDSWSPSAPWGHSPTPSPRCPTPRSGPSTPNPPPRWPSTPATVSCTPSTRPPSSSCSATPAPPAAALYLLELRHTGGALARPGAVPSALARRDGQFVLYAGAAAEPHQLPALHQAIDRLFETITPWSTGGVCIGFLSGPDVTASELATGYQPEDVDRLATIKHATDPHDTFRVTHGRA